MATGKLIDGGGSMLIRAKIVLSFNGSGWSAGSFSVNDALQAFNATLQGPYLSHLVQYKGIRRAQIIFSMKNTSDLGRLGPDPRKFVEGNIWLISDEDVRNVVRAAIAARSPQHQEEIFYLVVVSQNPIPIVIEEQEASGYHNTFEDNGQQIIYGVLLNQSADTAENTWKYLPGVFTHELIEACTDPDVTTGYRFEDSDEICDMGKTPTIKLPGLNHEITLSAYWSDLENKAVVPEFYSLRVSLGKRWNENVPSVKAIIKNKSVLQFISEGFENF